jgi:hypothetical protein
MRTRLGLVIAAVAGAVGLMLACSGKTVGGNGGGGGGSACDDYFQAEFAGSCPGTVTPPASEVARIQARFDTLCAEALALPGVGITSSGLESCVSAIKSTSCGVLNVPHGACSFDTGSLAAGGSCVTDSQCQTGDCSAGVESPDGGIQTCGVCSAPVPVGGSCANGGSCGPHAICNYASTGAQTCVAITQVAAGGACNTAEEQCNPGLACNASGVCAAPGPAGTPCESAQSCEAPLVCPIVGGGPSTCQAASAAGGPCGSAVDCALGLSCDFSTHQCTSVSWVAAGQACNGGSLLCLVGYCPSGNTGTSATCPTIIPDGQPCNPTDTTSSCDTFAQCTGGVCTLGYGSCP